MLETVYQTIQDHLPEAVIFIAISSYIFMVLGMNVMTLDTSLSLYFVIHSCAKRQCGNHVNVSVVVTLCNLIIFSLYTSKIFIINNQHTKKVYVAALL
jgi:hypothetical protein